MGKEIERKWLLESMPNNIEYGYKVNMKQAYLSTNPEVRIRSAENDNGYNYFLTIKSNGDLTRDEIEFTINDNSFYTLKKMIPYSFIQKDYYEFYLPSNLKLECSIIDKGTPNEFMYAEIEFPNEETALSYIPEFPVIKEITYDKEYKMKNYWVRTRLSSNENNLDKEIKPYYDSNTKQIDIHYLSNEIEKLCYVDGKSDWIDLRAAEKVVITAGEFKNIPLGISMRLPKGYEAIIIPRSSTFKNFGILQTNSIGLVDESYCGTNDQWFFPVIGTRYAVINKNDRIAQFRIQKHQPSIIFNEVDELNSIDRGGFGSTGKA